MKNPPLPEGFLFDDKTQDTTKKSEEMNLGVYFPAVASMMNVLPYCIHHIVFKIDLEIQSLIPYKKAAPKDDFFVHKNDYA